MAHQRGPQSRPRPSITLPPSPASSSDSEEIKIDLTNFSLAASKVLCCLEPTSEDITYREKLIDDFKKFTRDSGNLKGCTFEAYGSYAAELYTRCGDIDLSIIHEDNDILSKLRQHISRAGRELYLVTRHATKRVHVLTFERHGSHVPFDITRHTASGKMSASLLSHIKDIDVRFRQLVLLVKGWAMCHDINNASEGGFKSYALYVMVIFHFQTLDQPILPPLSELCTSEVMQKINDNDESWKNEFDENFARYTKPRDWKKNTLGIHEVFYLFIKKFKNISKKATEYYMSAKLGKWEQKTLPMLTEQKRKKQSLWIEEPFGESENLARTIKDATLTRIADLFKGTHRVIETGNIHDILEKLVTKDLLLKTERERDAIAMRSSVEVAPKAVASSDRIYVSSSTNIPTFSQKVLLSAKTQGTDVDDANGKSRSSSPGASRRLVCYTSDDDEDKEHGNLSISSENALGLDYASDEGHS